MGLSLFDLTYRAAREIGAGILVEGTATSGSTTAIVDSVERTEAADYWNLGTAFILYDAAGAGAAPQGEYSVISDFASNSVTLRSTLTAAVASGDRYALCRSKFPLQILIQNVNKAIQELGMIPVVDTTTITIAANQTEYTLPGAATLDLREVWFQTNDDSDDNQWRMQEGWKVATTSTGTASKLILPYQPVTGYDCKLVYVDYHPQLYVSSDKLSETIHVNRVVYAAAAGCLRWYSDRRRTNQFASTIAALDGKAAEASARHPINAIPSHRSILMIIRDDETVRLEDKPDHVFL